MHVYVCIHTVLCTRRSEKTGSHQHKGSALEIAAEYKRRRQAGELSPREAARATRITKRINKSEHKSNYYSIRNRNPEVGGMLLSDKWIIVCIYFVLIVYMRLHVFTFVYTCVLCSSGQRANR